MKTFFLNGRQYYSEDNFTLLDFLNYFKQVLMDAARMNQEKCF